MGTTSGLSLKGLRSFALDGLTISHLRGRCPRCDTGTCGRNAAVQWDFGLRRRLTATRGELAGLGGERCREGFREPGLGSFIGRPSGLRSRNAFVWGNRSRSRRCCKVPGSPEGAE